MSAARGHRHDDDGQGQGGGVDWFKTVDVIVWVAVAIIVCLGAEWLIGYLVREKIARGADKLLARVAAAKDAPPVE